MEVHRMEGDGNCLFRSCAYFLGICHHRLRKEVVRIIREYPDLPINGIPLSTWLEESGYGSCYPDHLSTDGFHGSALEISLISIIFRRTICVYIKENGQFKRIAEFFPEFGDEISLLWSGDHYDSLVEWAFFTER